jgi:peptidoglycan-N-acetylglucosamine deacetylase
MTPSRAALLAATALVVASAAVACAGAPKTSNDDMEHWAFTGPWDPRSAESAVRNGRHLDVVVSGWIGFDSLTGLPFVRYPDTLGTRLGTTRRMALVTSELNERFRPEIVRELARDRSRLVATSEWIARTVATGGYHGIVLDFENHERADLDDLVRVSTAIADSVRGRGVPLVSIAIPAGDTAAYPARRLLAFADYVLVMLYDQHWNRSAPGPVAAPNWVRQWLSVRVAEAGADRVVASLPLYGYQWRPDTAVAATVGFDDARAIAARSGVTLEREAASETLRARDPGRWELWVADAPLLRTLVAASRELGVRRFAYWRLGLEDPAIWGTLVRR